MTELRIKEILPSDAREHTEYETVTFIHFKDGTYRFIGGCDGHETMLEAIGCAEACRRVREDFTIALLKQFPGSHVDHAIIKIVTKSETVEVLE